MTERGRNNMAGRIARIVNHGFDGDARRSGRSEDELFKDVMGKIQRLDGHTSDDVVAGLAKAEGTHHYLLKGEQLQRAQSAIHSFFDKYVSRLD